MRITGLILKFTKCKNFKKKIPFSKKLQLRKTWDLGWLEKFKSQEISTQTKPDRKIPKIRKAFRKIWKF
jgi:hypothetical protein